MEESGRLDRGDGVELAWRRVPGRGPCVVFLPGFMSDMTGGKATAVAEWCARHGRAMLRLDYSGHGASDGAFSDGTIGLWLADTLAVLDLLGDETMLIIGSSMGGWIGLLAALARPGRVIGLIGIAAAPDFTERLAGSAAEHAVLARDGQLRVPSRYGGEAIFTHALIEDGRRHLLLGGAIPLPMPVRLLHGQCDPDVSWQTSLMLAERLESSDVQTILIKDGDHRLTRPADLALLLSVLGQFFAEGGA